MTIHIFSKENASLFVPERKTKVIRIYNSDPEIQYPDLQNNENYVAINEYAFDEIDPGDWGVDVLYGRFKNKIIFDEDLAARILDDFEQSTNFDDLLVHCNAGIIRSPAIAIALNDIYTLGDDPEALKRIHHRYGLHIYDTITLAYEKRRPSSRAADR